MVRASLRELASGLIEVAERHDKNYELWGTATVLAGWAREDDATLEPFIERYGVKGTDQPEKVRASLLGGVRVGVLGLLSDLTDLGLLAQQANMAWTLVFKCAKELDDRDLLASAGDGRNHAERAIRWIRTQVNHTAPEALAVGADSTGLIQAALPKGPDRVASIPDSIWGPLASALLILVTGAVALLMGSPWLLPSLGPTAVLAGEMPAHRMTRTWNTIVGHAGALLAGFAGVLIAGAANQPALLADHVLTPQRVLASVIAIGLTVLIGALLRASHPPAAATTLLVSLGWLRTLDDAVNLIAGVLVITTVAVLIRNVRTERVTPRERMAPRNAKVRRYVRTG
jgi:hypothetical protein